MKAVFVGGCPRSGTTLLGTMLAARLEATVTPESQFKNEWFRYGGEGTDPWNFVTGHPRFKIWNVESPSMPVTRPATIASATALAIRAYAQKTGQDPDAPWIDHTPSNLRFATTFETIEEWDVHYVHIVRDGRAIANSIMPLDWGPNTSLAAGRYWAGEVGAALGTETRYADKVLRVRYEDLLASPETITDRVASFAGLEKRAEGPDFETVRMPDYYTDNYHQLLKGGVDTSRSEAWRDRLSARDIELFEFASGELLDMLGYKSDFGVKARPPRLIERARLGFTDTMRETMHAFTWVRKLRRSG